MVDSFTSAMSLQQIMSSKKHGRKSVLPHNFSPSRYAVLCGRGSMCTKSPGNKRLKQLVQSYLKSYSEAKNKVEKSSIVSAIITAVKEHCPDGAAFVKYEDGAWWEVEEAFAREKIGCLFREGLHTQYRSSTKAKLARKKAMADSESVDDDGESLPLPPRLFILDRNQQISSHDDSFDASLKAYISAPALEDTTSRQDGRRNIDLRLSIEAVFGKEFDSHAFNKSFVGNGVDTHAQITKPATKAVPSKPLFPSNADGIHMENYSSPFGGNYTTGGAGGRALRQDFMRVCMPAAVTNFVDSSDTQQQQQQSMQPNIPRRASQKSSFLRAACDIVWGANDPSTEGCNNIDNDDFPDDLSEIFEDL